MKLSTRARYAVRIMAYIAANQTGGPLRKQQIAGDEGLSPDYIEQILVSLRHAGVVNSHRGAKGGFTLARPPAQITVKDIVEATEGPLTLLPPDVDGATSSPIEQHVTRPLWTDAGRLLSSYLAGKTVKDLVEKYEQQQNKAINYVI